MKAVKAPNLMNDVDVATSRKVAIRPTMHGAGVDQLGHVGHRHDVPEVEEGVEVSRKYVDILQWTM